MYTLHYCCHEYSHSQPNDFHCLSLMENYSKIYSIIQLLHLSTWHNNKFCIQFYVDLFMCWFSLFLFFSGGIGRITLPHNEWLTTATQISWSGRRSLHWCFHWVRLASNINTTSWASDKSKHLLVHNFLDLIHGCSCYEWCGFPSNCVMVKNQDKQGLAVFLSPMKISSSPVSCSVVCSFKGEKGKRYAVINDQSTTVR